MEYFKRSLDRFPPSSFSKLSFLLLSSVSRSVAYLTTAVLAVVAANPTFHKYTSVYHYVRGQLVMISSFLLYLLQIWCAIATASFALGENVVR